MDLLYNLKTTFIKNFVRKNSPSEPHHTAEWNKALCP